MESDELVLNIYTDGGARGNPGPAAVGVHIEDIQGNHVVSLGKKIGHTTNNVSEYKAVIEALDLALELNKRISKINFYLDSNLVVSQLNGVFKLKSPALRELLLKIREKEGELECPITYSYIPREKNLKADRLVNLALDSLA